MTTGRRISPWAVLALVVALVALAGAATAVLRYRAGEVHFTSALGTFQWSVYAGAAAVVLSLIGLWRSRRGGTRRGFLAAALALLLASPLVGYGVAFEVAARIYPPINDVTTSPEDPPMFWDVPNPQLYPGPEVAALQKEGYPELEPLVLDMGAARAFELATTVAREMGWEIVSRDPDSLKIEAVDTTLLFGFPDNVAVRVREVASGARVDVRSQSRLGRIDRGANARRINRYLDALEHEAAGGE